VLEKVARDDPDLGTRRDAERAAIEMQRVLKPETRTDSGR